jgi:hypothetical protein
VHRRWSERSQVQAVYAFAADRSGRYDIVAPLIAVWASQTDSALSLSAAETGGEPHIRFVTNGDCSLSVAHVVLSASGDDTFTSTATELSAIGFNRPDRKYLI